MSEQTNEIPRALMDVYLDWSGEQARAGILRCGAFERALLADKPVDQFMREELDEAGIEVPE